MLVDMRGGEDIGLQVSFPEGEPEGFEIVTRFFSGDPIVTALSLIADPNVPAFDGQPMNMDRIDVEAKRGELETWRITAEDMEHPFHIHGCSFRILLERGSEPPAYAQGWRDMVAVQEGVSEVLVRFDHPAGAETPYKDHCHILEHEDCGMMGQFSVS